jgi:peroxiredoxin
MQTLETLPSDLPIPLDDGACNHLNHAKLPSLALNATNNTSVNLAKFKGWLVLYCYPMTGQPDRELPIGWNEIQGARGCTPQSCAFRDKHQAFDQLNAQVFGLSSQATSYQQEAAKRLHLPFMLLSDDDFKFTNALKLPTFQVESLRLIKRVTLIVFDGVIQHYFYPVFPPDGNADEVINWLKLNA